METPDITKAQKSSAAAASTLLLAIIASPATDMVKCFAIACVAIVATAVIIADMGIRKGRAKIAEAAQYTSATDEEDG